MRGNKPEKPGVADGLSLTGDTLIPRPMGIGEIGSLRQGQRRFAWVIPFPVYLKLPDLELDVISEPLRHIGVPTDHVAVILNKVLFDYTGVRSDVVLPGNVVFGVPAAELPALSNFWRSMTLFDGQDHWVVRTQRIDLVDPTIPTSRVIENPRDLICTIYALLVFRNNDFSYFVPRGKVHPPRQVKLVTTTRPPWQDQPLDLLPELRQMVTAAAFFQGESDPFAKQEETLGHDSSNYPAFSSDDPSGADCDIRRTAAYDDVSDGLPTDAGQPD